MSDHMQTSESPATRILSSLDALSRLLSMNCEIDASRTSVRDRFTVTANRVTELAPPSGSGLERGSTPSSPNPSGSPRASTISAALEGALSSFASRQHP